MPTSSMLTGIRLGARDAAFSISSSKRSCYLAAELGPKGIRVHAISPGPVPVATRLERRRAGRGCGGAELLAEMRKHRCALSSRRRRRSGAGISDNVTLTYVGAYRVTVPAGTFDAAPLKWDFKGMIGRASVEDIQARFAPLSAWWRQPRSTTSPHS
jgi:NAD(P)-dependent dehydrogenase (short-subunit alcohol dehydrogenase family)